MGNVQENMQVNIQGNEPVTVPYVVIRDMQTHNRWVVRTLVRAIIICVFLIFLSNAIWLYVWYQYDYSGEETEVVTTVDSEGDGIANYTGHDGGVSIGEGNSQKDNTDENEN